MNVFKPLLPLSGLGVVLCLASNIYSGVFPRSIQSRLEMRQKRFTPFVRSERNEASIHSQEASPQVASFTEDDRGAASKSGAAEHSTTNVNPVIPIPMIALRGPSVLNRAYLDTFNILGRDNSCSQFYGGSNTSVEVLNAFVTQIKVESFLNPKMGLRMSGLQTNMLDSLTGVSYRLFERAAVNVNGPFFQDNSFRGLSYVPNVDVFRPKTREARVLILLHELGHLMKGADGKWLLPDDGNSEERSTRNTSTVMTHCSEQIKSLGVHHDN
jgi:hypothetical protein